MDISEREKTERAKKQVKKRIKDRKIRKLIPLEEIFKTERKYSTYYVINFPSVDIDSQLNVIATDKGIKTKIGNPQKITKMSKSVLLIQIASENQANLLKQINIIAQQPVTVEQHRTMNHSKGTVDSETMSRSTETEILDILKNQGVSKVERMKRRIDGALVDTHRYILTFNRTQLPSLIKLTDWHREIVEVYIPTPLRCVQCQRLGNTNIIATVTRINAPNVVTLATKQSPAPKNLSASTVEGSTLRLTDSVTAIG